MERTDIGVSKETYNTLKKMFGLEHDSMGSKHITITHNDFYKPINPVTNQYEIATRNYHVNFMIHQGDSYFPPFFQSYIYKIYISRDTSKDTSKI